MMRACSNTLCCYLHVKLSITERYQLCGCLVFIKEGGWWWSKCLVHQVCTNISFSHLTASNHTDPGFAITQPVATCYHHPRASEKANPELISIRRKYVNGAKFPSLSFFFPDVRLFFCLPAYLLPCLLIQLLPAHILPSVSLVSPRNISPNTTDISATDWYQEYEPSVFLCLFMSSWFLSDSVTADLAAIPALTFFCASDSRTLPDGAITGCSPCGCKEAGRGRERQGNVRRKV